MYNRLIHYTYMPQISRNKLSTKAQKDLINNVVTILNSISRKEEMEVFLTTFLTETEVLMLAKRLAIIILVSEGFNDSEIASTLHMTRITVAKTRYYYEGRGQEGLTIALTKIAKDKRLQEMKGALLALTRYSIRAAGGYVTPKIFD